ncbi:uncharacterized protein V6R79_018976 [Siganus canaliculatus]
MGMRHHSLGFLVLVLMVFVSGIVRSGPSTPRRSRVRRQNMKVRINATGDTIVMKFVRPNADTKLEGYILGYGSSMFSKQFIQLPENGQPYETEFDAEPKYLIAVQPIPVNEVKKQCTGKVELEKPLHLVIGSVTPTSVLLSWGTLLKTPYEGNVMNDCLEDGHYTVRYRERNRKWNYQTCPTSDTVIDNLKPNTVYEFGVQPSTKDGTGMWSKPVIHNISTGGIEERAIRKIFKRPITPVKPLPGSHSFPFAPRLVHHNRTQGRLPPSRNITPKTTLAPTTTTRQESLSTPGPTLPVVAKQPIGRGEDISRSFSPPFMEVPLTSNLPPPSHSTDTMASLPATQIDVDKHGGHLQRTTQSQSHTQPHAEPKIHVHQPQLNPQTKAKPQQQPQQNPISQTQQQSKSPTFQAQPQPEPQRKAILKSKLPSQSQPPFQPTLQTSQPIFQAQPQPEPQRKAILKGKPHNQPQPPFQPTFQMKSQPQPTSQSTFQAQPQPEPQRKAILKSKLHNQPQPPFQPTLQIKPQPHPISQPAIQSQPQTDPEHEEIIKTEFHGQPQPHPTYQPKTRPQPNSQPKPQKKNLPKLQQKVPPKHSTREEQQPHVKVQSRLYSQPPTQTPAKTVSQAIFTPQPLPKTQRQSQHEPPIKPHAASRAQPQPQPGLQFQTRNFSDSTKVTPRQAAPTAPSPPEEGKPLPRPALATEKAGIYNQGTGVVGSSVAEAPRSPISSSVLLAGRNATLSRPRVAPHSTRNSVLPFSPSKALTTSLSSSTPRANGAQHRGNTLPKPVVWSKEKPAVRPPIPVNKRPNLVGKAIDHDKPMDLKQGDKESILKPFALVTVKPKQERRQQTTTTVPPVLNSSRFDMNDNSSIFRPLPASEVDIMGKKRFVAPHVIYKTDKKPDEPCSITSSLAYFPDEEGGDQNVTGPPRIPPSNVTVVTVEGCPSFVILDWEKSDNETREYEVVSTTKGPNGEEVSIQTTNQTHTAVENLKPDSSYEFKVTPKNELGTGPSSDPVSFSTESADPRVSEYVAGKDAIWTQFPFKSDSYSECNGKQFVKRTWYRKFVGIQLCNSLRYKIYLSDSLNGKFYNIGDQTGHGEDHCQFVDSFLDGRTGSQMSADQLPSRLGFFRAMRQEPVSFGEIGGKSHVTYVGWYECGTPIPGKW